MHPRTIRSARIRCVTATGNSRESPSISDTTVLRDRLAGWAADRRVRWGAGIFGGLALGLVILIGAFPWGALKGVVRSEEHTSELQSLMRHSYAVLCLQKKNQIIRSQ